MATIQVIPTTHRYTEKEAHLLSGPSELQPPDAPEVYLLPRPLKTMAHRYKHTEKEAHLLSGPSELQSPDDSEAQKLRSSEVQHRSGNQDKNTANSQKQKKLSFKPHLFIMMIETLSSTILSRNFHLTLSTQQNQILPLNLYFRKKGGNCRRHSCTCRRHTCICTTCTTCTCTCTHTGDSRKMTTHSRIKKVNKELWEVSQDKNTADSQKQKKLSFKSNLLIIMSHSDSYIQTLSQPGLVDTQYNVGLYEQL